MKKALYIGINTYGSTSKMRADRMKDILSDWDIKVIDTDIPYNSKGRILKHLAFCNKIGPLIGIINKYIISHLSDGYYDLIWMDKAIFITPETTRVLRSKTKILAHYTPDPAFTFHKSKLFYKSIEYYDYLVTTKTYEIDYYLKYVSSKDKVLYVTQGFDKSIHRPMTPWKDKRGVAFIGHHETSREEPIKTLLNAGIDVFLAGNDWERFVKKNSVPNLHYLGVSIQGDEYVKAISSCLFALGSVSKWIPEKHTTRTFEIPACKTALLTERNDEIESFYSESDVIYYETLDELVQKVKYYTIHKDELKSIIENGYNVVQTGGYDFDSIMRNLLTKVLGPVN